MFKIFRVFISEDVEYNEMEASGIQPSAAEADMQKRSLFHRYFLSYMIVLILPLFIIVSITTVRMRRDILDNLNSYYTNNVTAGRNLVDQHLAEFLNAQYSIEHSYWLQNLYFETVFQENSDAVSLTPAVINALSFLNGRGRYNMQISFKLYNSNRIYTNSGVFGYDENVPAELQIPLPVFFPSEDGAVGFHEYISPDGTRQLIYVSPISNLYNSFASSTKGDINISIPVRRLTGDLDLPESAASFSVLTGEDPGSEICLSAAQDTEQVREFTADSSIFDSVRYCLRVPEDSFRAPVIAMLLRNALILLLGLAVAAIMAFLYSRQHVRPLSKLLTILPEQNTDSKDELFRISSGIREILRRYEEDESALESTRPIVAQQLLMRLLFEPCGPEMEEQLRKNQILFPEEKYRICLLLLPEAGTSYESDYTRAFRAVAEYYARQYNVVEYLFPLPPNRIVLFVNYREETDLQTFIRSLFGDCISIFGESGSSHVMFGISSIFSTLSEAPASYRESTIALASCAVSASSVAYFDYPGRTSTGTWQYSAADEAALRATLKRGDNKQAKDFITDLIRRNSASGELDISSYKCLNYQIFSTLIRTFRELDADPAESLDIFLFGTLQDYQDIHQFVLLAADKICDHVNGREAPADDPDLAIIRFVSDNVFHHTLSLQQTAERFGVSLSYVSRLVQARLGLPFNEYVNKARIGKAIELWDEDASLPVETVYTKVGYTNESTFRRNFKKITGRTPGTVKK